MPGEVGTKVLWVGGDYFAARRQDQGGRARAVIQLGRAIDP
jgi:hypothetical protein